MNLYLIGYRCTGKSTIGRMVAELLSRKFIDADDFLEDYTGRNIRDIFDNEGEEFFRDLESECLGRIAAQQNLVIAAGGGIILREGNVELMKSSGCIVLLKSNVDTIHQRMNSDGRTSLQRPNLTEQSPRDEIVSLLKIREPLYDAAAEAVFDTGELTVQEAAEGIADFLLAREEKS